MMPMRKKKRQGISKNGIYTSHFLKCLARDFSLCKCTSKYTFKKISKVLMGFFTALLQVFF
jgi:hypothetical protein